MHISPVDRSRSSYGWVIVAVTFVLLIGSFSTQLCFGLFVKPLTEEFGWSRAAVSGAMSLLMAVSGLIGVVMGRATDKYGARAAVAPGVLIGALSFLLLSRMNSLWQFYLLFGVGGGILAGCSYTPSVTVVSWWFDMRRRTMAIGVALLGIIVGQMILAPVVAQVIDGSGWRTAWAVLAIIAFVCGLPAIVVIGSKPAREEPTEAGGEEREAAGPGEVRQAGQSGEGLSTKEACKTFAFWNLMLAGAVLGLGYYAFAAHVVPYATDVGLSNTAAALILTVSSIGGFAGSLLAGVYASRLGFRYALLTLTALNGIAIFLFIPAGSVWAFYLLSVILGFAFSCVVPVRMGVIPPLFGMRAVGGIVGLTALSFSAGAIAGPFIAGYVFDATGNYDLAFAIFGVLLVAGAALLYFLRVPKTPQAVEQPSEPALIWRAGDGLE